MGDLTTTNTNYPNTLDTATTLADNTDTVLAIHQNAPNTAIIALETELGLTPKGTAATLAARLGINLHADGGLLRGTSFPVSPPNVPHLFYRTDTNYIYVYNTVTAQYDIIANLNVLANYVRSDTATTIAARHTFNPTSANSPFILGANAQGQNVVGLDADTVDGKHPAVMSGLATLDASSLVVQNPTNATVTPTASKIPIADGDGKLDAWISNSILSGRKVRYEVEHFGSNSNMITTQVGTLGWTFSANSCGVTYASGEDAFRIQTSSVISNIANLLLSFKRNQSSFSTLFKRVTLVSRVLPTDITSVKIKIGITSVPSNGDIGAGEDGLFFHYDPIINADWRAITVAAGTVTATDTLVVPVAGVFQDFKIVRRTIASDGVSDVRFFINDSLVGTHTTNIPVGTAALFYGETIETTTASPREFYCNYSSLFAEYA